jgi:hypothetical protein
MYLRAPTRRLHNIELKVPGTRFMQRKVYMTVAAVTAGQRRASSGLASADGCATVMIPPLSS